MSNISAKSEACTHCRRYLGLPHAFGCQLYFVSSVVLWQQTDLPGETTKLVEFDRITSMALAMAGLPVEAAR